MSRIAVIGAGIAGLTLAGDLQAAGHAVTLFEKSRGPGGRCATRRSTAGPFDHGAPHFSATTAAFRAQLTDWHAAGWVAPDQPADRGTRNGVALQHACGVPSMNALAQRLASGLPAGVDLRANTQVTAIGRDNHGSPVTGGGWRLQLSDGPRAAEPFDAVAVAVPAEQAAALLAPDAALADAMRQVRSDPCWTVMAAWPNPLPAAFDAHRDVDTDGVLSLAQRDDVRAGRSNVDGIGCRWVLHATPQWTRDHLEADAADVIAALTGALAQRLGVRLDRPVHAAAHRWRYARIAAPRVEPFGWSATSRLGACGDAWHAIGDTAASRPDGVERAWLSGRSLAREMLRTLARD